jgi:hypothetical protein
LDWFKQIDLRCGCQLQPLAFGLFIGSGPSRQTPAGRERNPAAAGFRVRAVSQWTSNLKKASVARGFDFMLGSDNPMRQTCGTSPGHTRTTQARPVTFVIEGKRSATGAATRLSRRPMAGACQPDYISEKMARALAPTVLFRAGCHPIVTWAPRDCDTARPDCWHERNRTIPGTGDEVRNAGAAAAIRCQRISLGPLDGRSRRRGFLFLARRLPGLRARASPDAASALQSGGRVGTSFEPLSSAAPVRLPPCAWAV